MIYGLNGGQRQHHAHAAAVCRGTGFAAARSNSIDAALAFDETSCDTKRQGNYLPAIRAAFEIHSICRSECNAPRQTLTCSSLRAATTASISLAVCFDSSTKLSASCSRVSSISCFSGLFSSSFSPSSSVTTTSAAAVDLTAGVISLLRPPPSSSPCPSVATCSAEVSCSGTGAVAASADEAALSFVSRTAI